METDVSSRQKRSRWAANAIFYPAAALHAAVVLPWSVLAMTGRLAGSVALASPLGHAHEMLAGYALAVVAGNQLPPMPAWRVGTVFGLWALARAAFLVLPSGVGAALDIAFVTLLGLHVAPRLFRAAKKLRNQALPGVLTALCAAAIAYDVAALLAGTAALPAILTAFVLLLALLMLFMGGRMIAPAAAGQLYRQGESLAARVQPRIEGALILVLTLAIVAAVLPRLELVLRTAAAVAGVLALVRLLRWRLWACKGRPDLLCLGAGYAWLAVGLLAIACSVAGSARTAALHVITVGALGTLTFNVMANTMLLKARRTPAREPLLVWGTTLIGIATACRVAAALVSGGALELLTAAAGCWSAAFLTLLWLIARGHGERAEHLTQRRARSDG